MYFRKSNGGVFSHSKDFDQRKFTNLFSFSQKKIQKKSDCSKILFSIISINWENFKNDFVFGKIKSKIAFFLLKTHISFRSYRKKLLILESLETRP